MGYTASHINVNNLDALCKENILRDNYVEMFIMWAENAGVKIEGCTDGILKRCNVFTCKTKNSGTIYIYYQGGHDWWVYSKNVIEELIKKKCNFLLIVQANSFDNNECHFWVADKPDKFKLGIVTFQERPKGTFYSSPKYNEPPGQQISIEELKTLLIEGDSNNKWLK